MTRPLAAGPELLHCIAFAGLRRIASGELPEVALKTKRVIERAERAPILIFDKVTSRPIEIDFRGTSADVLRRLMPTSQRAVPVHSEGPDQRGPGRPKLGVIAREVTLLPRHWDWLNEQPGSASVALRKLVEEARRGNQWKDRARQSQESVHRFMYAMTGDLPAFEEASRAFYAKNQERFEQLIDRWPKDIRNHLKQLAATAWKDETIAAEKQPKSLG